MPICITLSAELFWGFQLEFQNELSSLSKEDQTCVIENEFKQQLKEYFKEKNLQLLMERVDVLVLHLHEALKPDSHTYACDHDHSNGCHHDNSHSCESHEKSLK